MSSISPHFSTRNPLVENDYSQVQPTSTKWHCNKTGSIFTRIKYKETAGKGYLLETCYKIDKRLSSGGIGGIGEVFLLKPIEGTTKAKAIKITGVWVDLEYEYSLSLSLINKTVGLAIHPKAYFSSDKQKMIIMPKYDGTVAAISSALSLEEKLNAIYQISFGLSKLHERDIIYGDLKLTNVLYNSTKSRYDIIDFGGSYLNSGYDKANECGDLRDNIACVLMGIDYEYSPSENEIRESLSTSGYSQKVSILLFDLVTNKSYNSADIYTKSKLILEEYKKSPKSRVQNQD